MAPPRLLGPSELAERWGITPQRIHQLVTEGQLPPGEQLAAGRIWTIDEIEEYEQRTGRRPRVQGLGTHDVAELLGVSRSTVLRLRKDALAYETSAGSHRRYRRADVVRYAREHLGREIG